MSTVLNKKVIKDGVGKRVLRMIAAAMLAPAIMIGAASCSKSADDYKPKTSIVKMVEVPAYSYADNSRFVLSGDKFIPKDDDSTMKIVRGLIDGGDPLDYAKKLGPTLRSTWDTVVNNTGLGLMVRVGDAIYIQDPSDNNKIVSESVYWLSISGRAHYFGVSTVESQAFFDGMLIGVDNMVALARADKGAGVFPGWVMRIDKETGQLILDKTTDAAARNSASDADHDLIMGLLIAIDNVRQGIWEDHGYAQRLNQLIGAAEGEYTLIAGTYVLQPSEDYSATEKEHDFRIDYHSPATCFALAQYLESKGDPVKAKQWVKRGQDSIKVYIATLKACNRIPSKAWISEKNGALVVTPYGTQGYDGIRGPERLAEALRYVTLSPDDQKIVENYLSRWGETYTVPGLDAAVYLPLAIHVGDTNAAERLSEQIVGDMSDVSIYKDQRKYFQISVIAKSLLEVLYPYNVKATQDVAGLSKAPSRLAELTVLAPADVYNVADGYFGETPEGFGFIINNNPLQEIKDILPPGNFVINSESMAYGLSKAVADKDWHKVGALLKTIYYFSQLNYQETSATLRLLPWAVIYNGKTFQIAQKGGIANYGNASASDADQVLLAAMMQAVQAGYHDPDLRNFIALYADDFIQYDVAKYAEPDGSIHSLLKSGGFIEPEFDAQTGDSIYQYHTSYPNYKFLQYLADYFKADGMYNTVGSTYRYAVFSQLLLDTKTLMGKIIEAYPTGKDFPELVYVRVAQSGGVSLIDGDEDHLPVVDMPSSWRLPMNIGFDPEGYFSQSLQQATVTPDYYNYYVSEMTKITYPTDASRFSIDDTIYHNGLLQQLFNMGIKHYKHFFTSKDLSPFYDQRYDRSVSVPDSSQISPNLVGYYQNRSTNYDYLKLFIQYACELANGRDTAYQAVAVYEDTLVKYMMHSDLSSIYVNVPVKDQLGVANIQIPLVASDLNIVDQYFTILTSMFGYNHQRLIDKIDTLLVIAGHNGCSADNAVVRELNFQKLLLWGELTPLAKTQMEKAAQQYHWESLSSYLKSPPFRQDELRQITVTWEGQTIDTATMTVDQFAKANIPVLLKDIIVSEITKREVKAIVDRNLSPLEMQNQLEAFVRSLPAEYKMRGLIPILYTEGTLDDYGVRSADPIPREVKAHFITTTLEKIKRTDKDYIANYTTLWSAYKLLVYKDVNNVAQNFKLTKLTATPENTQAMTENLIKLIRMIDLVQQTGINVDAAGLPKGSDDPIFRLFQEKYFDDLYVQYRSTYGYMDTMADIFNNLYWLGYDLDRLVIQNPGIPKAYVALYEQLKPAIYDGKLGIASQGLIELYKLKTPGWENNHKLYGAIKRIELQETVSIANIQKILNELHTLQKKAQLYGQNEEYAYFKVSEAFVYALVPYFFNSHGIQKTGYDYYQEILRDPTLKKYDYMLGTVKDMKLLVEGKYKVSTPSSRKNFFD